MPKGIINQSYELRKLIIQQAERFNIPLTHICRRVGLNHKRFLSNYCNKKNLSTTRTDIVSDSDLLDIAAMLGVEIRIQLIVKNTSDAEMSILKNELKDAFGYKEKRSASKIE